MQCWLFGISASFKTIELEETFGPGTFAFHAGCLIYWDFSNMRPVVSAAEQQGKMSYQARQSDSCYILQLRDDAEYFIHYDASFEIYLRKFTLLWNLEKSDSDTSVLCVFAPTTLVFLCNYYKKLANWSLICMKLMRKQRTTRMHFERVEQ